MTVPLLSPPSAPTIDGGSGALLQTSTSPGEAGGLVKLYESADGLNWSPVSSAAFATPYDWGNLLTLPTAFLAGTEVGDGVHYLGESALSNVWDNT